LKSNHKALALAQKLSHPPSLAFALTDAAWLHQCRREAHAAQEQAEAAIALCAEQGIPFFLANGTVVRGWALAQRGQIEEGIAQVRQGMTAWQAMGAEGAQSWWLALLAEVYGKRGQSEEGLTALTEALTLVEKNDERVYEAELYRLKGTLVLQSTVRGPASPNPNPQTEAEAYFLKAIEISQRQQAKSLELRAVISLSRLWQSQERKDAARQLLADIYGWFTEGFDTKDLQEAKALLDELGRTDAHV
jgi:predicted ATPase